jgi:LacI family transcriptional regulator
VALSATILDVAKLAQVSPSTVTHALNGKRPVSDETKDRILAAIHTLNYIPSHNASHLRKGRSGVIGCYVLDHNDAYTHRIVKGIGNGLTGSDLSMLFVSAAEFDNDFSKAYRFFLGRNIEGLLLCHYLAVLQNPIEEITNSPFPVIALNMRVEGMKSILPDNVSGGMLAADHLYASGMRHPGMICGPQTRLSTIERLEGFRKRISALELPFPESRYIYGTYAYEHGYDAALELIRRDKKIDGIFCANDYLAAGAMNRLTEAGYKIPEDIRILGCDNRDFSAFWPVPISTFELPFEEMGFLGVSELRCAINSKVSHRESRVLQPKLLVRASTSRSAGSREKPEQEARINA